MRLVILTFIMFSLITSTATAAATFCETNNPSPPFDTFGCYKVDNDLCGDCDKPGNSIFTSTGHILADSNSCDWECGQGFFLSPTWDACNPCPAGYQSGPSGIESEGDCEAAGCTNGHVGY